MKLLIARNVNVLKQIVAVRVIDNSDLHVSIFRKLNHIF